MSERVVVETVDGVAHVRMNRPDKRNALDRAMFEALVATGESLTHDKSVRAVVLSGEGKAFCAGLDFASFLGGGDSVQSTLDRLDGKIANIFQQAAWAWQEVPVPVIAAVHGVAFGGGCQIALGADIRYATPDTQFSVMEIRWGLIPDMSITATLLRLTRADIAKELTFTGRRIDGNEAASLGLVTHVVDDPVASALELAKLIASKSPHAIRASKTLLRDAPDLNTKEALLLETDLQRPLLGSPNQIEAVQANMTKRAPVFKDPD